MSFQGVGRGGVGVAVTGPDGAEQRTEGGGKPADLAVASRWRFVTAWLGGARSAKDPSLAPRRR